jgi:hypothetical protein
MVKIVKSSRLTIVLKALKVQYERIYTIEHACLCFDQFKYKEVHLLSMNTIIYFSKPSQYAL